MQRLRTRDVRRRTDNVIAAAWRDRRRQFVGVCWLAQVCNRLPADLRLFRGRPGATGCVALFCVGEN
jgi:hypothetical protein